MVATDLRLYYTRLGICTSPRRLFHAARSFAACGLTLLDVTAWCLLRLLSHLGPHRSSLVGRAALGIIASSTTVTFSGRANILSGGPVCCRAIPDEQHTLRSLVHLTVTFAVLTTVMNTIRQTQRRTTLRLNASGLFPPSNVYVFATHSFGLLPIPDTTFTAGLSHAAMNSLAARSNQIPQLASSIHVSP